MRPGREEEDDLPWDVLYLRALRGGIGDATFWQMSPAALIRLTPGKQTHAPTRTGRRRPMGKPRGPIGGLADCP